MNIYMRKLILGAMICAAATVSAVPPIEVDYSAEVLAGASTGDFAPYMIASWRNGLLSQQNNALLDLKATKSLDRSRRFSWGAGIEAAAGYASATAYERYDAATQTWGTHSVRPSAVRIQQLYGELKYRQVFLMAGMRAPHSYLVDERVSSGDLARSNNARAIPSVEAGFLDFVDIPFTRSWVQIDGALGYGKFTDSDFRREQFNYYNDLLATGVYYTYKRIHFRSNPSKPFSATIGMQAAGQFGGYTQWYDRGKMTKEEKHRASLRDFLDMLLPMEGNGDGYYKGSSLGTIDIKLRYRLRSGAEITAYLQNPWEDGSGLGKFNGWDGLWGIAYHNPERAIITDAAIEWLDFTNESGPIAWQPGDYPGCTQTNATSGGDNYFNNDMYGAYANYGMAIGSPFIKAPVYNLDGTPLFEHNMCRGVHAAVAGAFGSDVDWRVMYSYQQAWGMGRLPSVRCYINNSAMAEATWRADRFLPGLSMGAQVAFDAGSLRGNTFGALVSVKYSGSLSFK